MAEPEQEQEVQPDAIIIQADISQAQAWLNTRNEKPSPASIKALAQEFAGLAIENLKGIRKTSEKGSNKSKAQRQKLNSWAFFQLRAFITYKCQLYGVDLRVVDPSYTSVTCPLCGCRNKKNRLTRDRFRCFTCSHTGYSDLIAAVNIRAKALGVTAGLNGFQPYASYSHSLGATGGTAVT